MKALATEVALVLNGDASRSAADSADENQLTQVTCSPTCSIVDPRSIEHADREALEQLGTAPSPESPPLVCCTQHNRRPYKLSSCVSVYIV